MVMPELAQNLTLEGQMASYSPAPFGKKLGQIEYLQDRRPSSRLPMDVPGSSAQANDIPTVGGNAFAALTNRQGRPLRIAILSDFTRISYANGAAFQTRFLYQELRQCGHKVTIIGPRDPDATEGEIGADTISLPSVPMKSYPGLHLPLPLEPWVFDANRWDFDLVYAQTTSLLLEFGVWLRKMRGIPLLCVNTTHLAAAYEVLLPEAIAKYEAVHAGILFALQRPYERLFARIYNESDGLIVLSEGLRSYWRERGVTAPIHVIPRTVQPEMFDRPIGEDPYVRFAGSEGARLLCAGRHTREKAQDRVIRIFAEHVAPRIPHASLTLLGEGPDTEFYKSVAEKEGVAHRVHFPGEVPFDAMVDFYAHADLFVHASLSETYGNVMGEALWSGTPTVAFADGMGVSSQIKDGINGRLLAPGGSELQTGEADRAFGNAVVHLLEHPEERAALGKQAARVARERAHPNAVKQKIAEAFKHAQDHARACGLRAQTTGPKIFQWATTVKHFRSWAAINTGVYLMGHLRPASAEQSHTVHPQIGK